MHNLSIDIETYSSENLARSGVYRYAEAPDFRVLLFGWSMDDEPVQVIDLEHGEELPEEILEALMDDSVVKWAFNAAFERVCLSRFLRDRGRLPEGKFLSPGSWHCTMIWCAYLGMPLSLAGAGAVLGLDKQKLTEGKDLIRRFCMPGGNEFRLHAARVEGDDWMRFIEYNRRDVETEQGIQGRLAPYPIPEEVWEQYALDQEINDRGIRTDLALVMNAIVLDEEARITLEEKLRKLTGLNNPNSVSQLKGWLAENGTEAPSLGKRQIIEMLSGADRNTKEVLHLRQQLAKSSVRKYQAMAETVCMDGRIRGMFQFYGAVRSGRWAGRGVQLQNLPQNHLADLAGARELVLRKDREGMEVLYGSVPDVLSELIRTAFIPEEGKKFIVADFSAIEARVIAWLAGETWRMEVFSGGGDIYCASASRMFRVPVEKNGVNGHLRQKGKIAELALGYGGSVGALRAMGALEMGLTEEELQELVNAWRKANPKICRLWQEVDQAVKTVIRNRTTIRAMNMTFSYRSGILLITLPSGRTLSYIQPRLERNRYGGESISYMGLNTAKKWERIDSYGPKFVENIVQGIARDLLCEAMFRINSEFRIKNSGLKERKYAIVAHVHDEVIIEADPEDTVEEVCRLMGECPPWAEGLLLRADGYECAFYCKQ
ncbi:DNA polymerase [Clostridiales bacterium FE2010]|nr:DNA polymerase [Clostridiales bacterium FE2010]